MTIDITRDLLLHYLRATCHPSWAETVAAALDAGERINAVLDKIPGPDIRFRLGLCAAAEWSLQFCHEHNIVASPMGNTITDQAHQYLFLAGITPDAWEAAR